MATDGWIPEIVIGVDFGMTCTGRLARKISNEATLDMY